MLKHENFTKVTSKKAKEQKSNERNKGGLKKPSFHDECLRNVRKRTYTSEAKRTEKMEYRDIDI